MKICVAGKNQIAIDVLEAVLERFPPTDVFAIGNKVDVGRTSWQPSFKRRARALGVAVVELDDVYGIADLVFLSIEFDRIVRPDRFRSPALFNIHFSLLPKHRGMYTSVWPVLHGEDHSGVTLHRIDPGIDTGDIIAQRRFAVTPEMTSRDVYSRYLRHGSDLVIEHLDRLVRGSVTATPQPSDGATYFSKKSLDFSAITVPTAVTAWQLGNFIRAFAFREYQFAEVEGLPIAKAIVSSTRSQKKPGEVVDRGLGWITVATVDFDVRLEAERVEILVRAARADDVSSVKALLAEGALVDARNGRGWSALHAACFQGSTAAARALLDAGADPNVANFRGTTAVMYCRSSKDRAAASVLLPLLKTAGADFGVKDEDGRDAADYAAAEGDSEFVELLKR
jgi:methionyl-tRNA formyltransferase